jgi:hypothetical protein
MITASGFASKQANSPALLVLPYTLIGCVLASSVNAIDDVPSKNIIGRNMD